MTAADERAAEQSTLTDVRGKKDICAVAGADEHTSGICDRLPLRSEFPKELVESCAIMSSWT